MYPLDTWRNIQLSIQPSKSFKKYNILDKLCSEISDIFHTSIRELLKRLEWQSENLAGNAVLVSCYPCMNKTFNYELWIMNYDTIIRLFRWFIVPLDTHNKINDKNIKLRTKGNNPTSHMLLFILKNHINLHSVCLLR